MTTDKHETGDGNDSSVIERIPILRRFHCRHERIIIAGFRDGAKADYRCKECDRKVKPWEMEKDYRWVGAGADR